MIMTLSGSGCYGKGMNSFLTVFPHFPPFFATLDILLLGFIIKCVGLKSSLKLLLFPRQAIVFLLSRTEYTFSLMPGGMKDPLGSSSWSGPRNPPVSLPDCIDDLEICNVNEGKCQRFL